MNIDKRSNLNDNALQDPWRFDKQEINDEIQKYVDMRWR